MTALACIVASGSVDGVMNGHHYNRSIRYHKLMAGALHVFRWMSFSETLSEKDAKQYEDLLKCLQSSFPCQMYADLLEESAFQALLKR